MLRDALAALLLALIIGAMLAAAFVPNAFGKWLQKIDDARYEYLDCDCTESL